MIPTIHMNNLPPTIVGQSLYNVVQVGRYLFSGVLSDAIWIERLGPDEYQVDSGYERVVQQLDKLFESDPFAVIASNRSEYHPDFDTHAAWVE